MRSRRRGAPGEAGQGTTPLSSGGKATGKTIVLSTAVILVVAAIAGFAIYRDRVRPLGTTVLVVDDTRVDMRYFLKRVAMTDKKPTAVLETLMKEEILKQTVTRPPYSIEVSEHDVDQFARDLARGEAGGMEEREYREWYRQQLNETRLSDREFRDLLRTMLLRVRASQYLAERIPTAAEQVYLNLIPVKNIDLAVEIKKSYDSGESFSALAQRYSEDPALRQNGGVVGWLPRGVLDEQLDDEAFKLPVGKASAPFYLGDADQRMAVVIMVSERAALRQIDEQYRQALESGALDAWLEKEYANHRVEYRGFTNGYDSETDAWVNQRLASMRPGKGQEETPP